MDAAGIVQHSPSACLPAHDCSDPLQPDCSAPLLPDFSAPLLHDCSCPPAACCPGLAKRSSRWRAAAGTCPLHAPSLRPPAPRRQRQPQTRTGRARWGGGCGESWMLGFRVRQMAKALALDESRRAGRLPTSALLCVALHCACLSAACQLCAPSSRQPPAERASSCRAPRPCSGGRFVGRARCGHKCQHSCGQPGNVA